ncbi:hypothetical protein SGUI_3161 [Serinicoccus hydrothermalis]|uniref:Probable membrane transporter protein n=1 Tax=Serinicoccus hydrothermalis TaxID=1758689 RepID=A0A1B1NGJ2_9MICO|nr:sulfite exporter TauE/SafE family protein [Serinicoccus hydrothermalis]ANS80557.1 hypothetical protein SGUI_3161 [Serinicoccus hydrothermalis]
MTLALLLVLTVALGAALQRVSGMGLGMTVAPVMSVVVGPVAGVTLSNVAAVVGALLLAYVMRADIDWRRFRGLAPLLVVGSVVGAWVVRVVSPDVLDLVLGGCVLLAIGAALGLQRLLVVRGRAAVLVTGTVAGFMNTTAGVAGPAMTAYAVASRWGQRSLAATLQPIFLTANLASILTKAVLGATPEPGVLPWWSWLLACAAVPVGIVLATPLARLVPLPVARALAITIASAGAALALGRGLVGVLG